MAIAIIFLLPQKPPESGNYSKVIVDRTKTWKQSFSEPFSTISLSSEGQFLLAFLADGKYAVLETRPPTFTSNSVESSFKHYADENGPPEVINVTSSAGGTILPPDQV